MNFFYLTPLNGIFFTPNTFFNQRTKEEKTPPLKDCKKMSKLDFFAHPPDSVI